MLTTSGTKHISGLEKLIADRQKPSATAISISRSGQLPLREREITLGGFLILTAVSGDSKSGWRSNIVAHRFEKSMQARVFLIVFCGRLSELRSRPCCTR